MATTVTCDFCGNRADTRGCGKVSIPRNTDYVKSFDICQTCVGPITDLLNKTQCRKVDGVGDVWIINGWIDAHVPKEKRLVCQRMNPIGPCHFPRDHEIHDEERAKRGGWVYHAFVE